VKTIDATLLSHMGQPSTKLTKLLLVGPLDDNSYRGFTELDEDVVFAPTASLGELKFKARTGFELSNLAQTNDGSVDNAEATSLRPVSGFEVEGFTQAEIDSGILDKVRFCVFAVNYNDLTAGRAAIVAGGTIGEAKIKLGSMTVLELRSLTQQLMQTAIIRLTSLTCRAKFGSQPFSSSGTNEERFPCGFDAESLWVSGTVTGVGGEADFQFIDTSLSGSSFTENQYAPGLVEFLTGDNAGLQVEVDAYDYATGIIDLRFPTPSPISPGDTYRIREQCTKNWTGHNSCDTFWAADKPLHFRGEPWIPVGQASQLTVPGAGTPSGVGGTNIGSTSSV